MRKFFTFLICSTLVSGAWAQTGRITRTDTFQRPSDSRNSIVTYTPGGFAGWPANNGIWTWDGGADILVGFSYGEYEDRKGHNLKPGEEPRNGLARSTDGGKTWTRLNPANYADQTLKPTVLRGRVDFTHPGFALKVSSPGYHGHGKNGSNFYVSYDRGASWSGPYLFNGLDAVEQVKGWEITSRTDYQVVGKDECLVFFSARWDKKRTSDKTFVLRTTDGGQSFAFYGWVVPPPPADTCRGVMPHTVRLSDKEYLTVTRRRKLDSKTDGWIEAYYSKDGGRNWEPRSVVGYTGSSNGNPPSMVRMRDGRIAVIYGNRSLKMVLGRISADNGRTWGKEIIIRDDFTTDSQNESDLGYPRLTQNADGKLVAIYYFSDKDHREQHIACTVFSPDGMTDVPVKRRIVYTSDEAETTQAPAKDKDF